MDIADLYLSTQEPPKETYSYWVPQNTAWSGGTIWFDTGGDRTKSSCHKTREEAEATNLRVSSVLKYANIKYRVVLVEVTETYYESPPDEAMDTAT